MTDAAAVLYGTPTVPAQEPAEAPLHVGPAEVGDDPAARLYGSQDAEDNVLEVEITSENMRQGLPDELVPVRALREAQGIDVHGQYQEVLANELFIDDETGIDAEIAPVIASEIRLMAADAGLQPADITMLREAIRSERTTAENYVAQGEAAIAALNARYGEGATQALRDAKAFVAADSRREAILQHVGFHPRVVLRMAELAAQAQRLGNYPFNRPTTRR